QLKADSLKPFEKFYLSADLRSHKMIANLLAQPSTSARVLVAGGFHTPLLTQLLREKKISYVVVSPKISKGPDGSASAYLSIFSREHTPLEKIFAGERLFLNPEIVGGVATDRTPRLRAIGFWLLAGIALFTSLLGKPFRNRRVKQTGTKTFSF